MREAKVEQNVSFGLVWIAGWLFTIGFLDLSFWRGALALLLWPYLIGAEVAPVPEAPQTQEVR